MNSEKPSQVNNHRYFRRSRYGQDKFVLVRQQKIHYIEAGQGEPVVLISGSKSTFRVWNRIMPCLDGQYRLLMPDYHEFGKDADPQALTRAVQQQADLIASMLATLNLKQVNLIGSNLGGTVAFNLAARYPDLAVRVAGLSALIGLRHKLTERAAPATVTEPAQLSGLEEEAKAIRCPILYLYGTHTGQRESTLAHDLKYLQTYHQQAWIVALEGGIFEIAIRNPREIGALLQDFLKFKPGLRIG